jgi:long-subunit acyl-CoA synthetase (AMP-forming)
MRGYRNKPEATAEAIIDGWLHTGDIGELDEAGDLKITDRKKELIIGISGKNMSPAYIEHKLKEESELIGQAIAIGSGRRYNVALLVLDPVAREAFSGDVEAEVAAAVARANERMARVEQIKKYKLLTDEWLPGGEELTPTMKLKRKPIESKYAAEIEALYEAVVPA